MAPQASAQGPRRLPDRPIRSRVSAWRIVIGLYLVLLIASHGLRLVNGRFQDSAPAEGRRSFETTELWVGPNSELIAGSRQIRLAWWEWQALSPASPSESPVETPVVLLVHGSPGDGSNFHRLAPLLAEQGFRVLAPDLPGFGGSSQQIADYSIHAHAGYLAALVDHLGIETVHAVGFSLGGGVVIHLEEQLRERVRSLTLLSAVGVQELELLGRYSVNHAIHGAQLAALLLLQEGFPHFGLLDRSHAHLSYARNFYDSDQRPLRRLLEAYQGPMLIMHGRDDFLVPYEAALEHRRIVPQSQLVSFDEGNHFLVFRRPEALVPPLVEHFRASDSGAAGTRATAPPQRLVEAREGAPQKLPRAVGPTLMVWIFLLAVATLVSEDLTCLAAGLLVAQGSLGFASAVFGCALGIFIGDMGLFALGLLGRPFLHRAPLRWLVSESDLDRSRAWFDRKGAWAILISRFLPGLRVPTYVSAGLLGMNLFWFTLSLFLPILLWTPLLVGLASWLGDRVFSGFEAFEDRALPLFFAVLVAFWVGLLLSRALLSWRGRRLLLGKWKRWTQWEFWPQWAFYPPVALYVGMLAIRYRSLTLFTAANPGLPAAGGLVGESKTHILSGLGEQAVAPWRALEPGPEQDRRQAIERFQQAQENPWPVVLKPDVGERGSGVTIARDPTDIANFLSSTQGPAIVQQYISGVELGVFWVRMPDEPSGRIFSVTHKQLPAVIGDGQSTIEKLILQDARAIAMADTYLRRFQSRLGEVPAAGERLRLVEVGTHCLGAVFVDGSQYVTPEMEAAVGRIANRMEGFYFGRFDLRAPSFGHFQRGEQISVLELNGVTSEATHIYDPKHRIWQAWRILFEQWRLAFEIGRRNREMGHSPASLSRVWQLIREFRAR